MSNRHFLALVATIQLTAGGCCLAPPKTPDTVPVHVVVDKVKDQLRSFYDSPLLLKQTAADKAICKSADNMNVVMIRPASVKLTLKTVATTENDPSFGLAAPLGVLEIDPAYSGAYSRSNTQSLELDLDLAPFKNLKATSPMALAQPAQGSPTDYPLRDVVASMGQELLEVDHTKAPCVKPTGIKSVINFDVVNKSTGGVGIVLLGFKIGDKVTASDEYHQVLEIDFSLEGSSYQLH